MHTIDVKKGTTDVTVYVKVIDSTAGTPETGVTFETAGIDLWYMREGADHTAITEATQTVDGAHSDGGFVHVSDGVCRLDLPDAACATGVDYVYVGGTITGMIVIGCAINLVAYDPFDTVRLGLTALPDAAQSAAGGIPVKTDIASASDVVDEFETQSQADPTGFHVNVLEIGGTTQTANDNGADINAILADTGTDGVVVAAASVAAIAAAGYMVFEKNVALTKVPIKMTDSTNHAAATGKTVTLQASYDGAAFADITDVNPAEIGSGWYEFDLTQAEMNYNFIILKGTATDCDQAEIVIRTQS